MIGRKLNTRVGFPRTIIDYFLQKKATPSQLLEQSRLLSFSPSVVPKRVSRKLAGDLRSVRYIHSLDFFSGHNLAQR